MLTPRLKCITDHIEKCRCVADIGTDHAYVPIKLIEEKKADFAIASDINKGPLSIAEENILKYGFCDKIETRLGGGLSTLSPKEADIIIIAGMGGEIIEEILKADEECAKASRLVLQPMNSQYELRKFLIKSGYRIIDEDIATEGFKVYNVIIAEAGCQKEYENDFHYQLPPYLYSHRYFKNLYEKKKREFEKVINGLDNASERDEEKYARFTFFLDELKKIKF